MAFSEEVAKHFLWRLACLSPLVEKRLSTEDYRFHLLVDEDTEEEKLYDLTLSALHDLDDIGITFRSDITVLYQSDTEFEEFLNVLDYLFPSSLYLKLRDDKVLRAGLSHMVDGTTDTDHLLEEWLDYIARIEPSLREAIGWFKIHFIGNGTFLDYLKGLHVHLEDQAITPILDPDRIKLVDTFIARLKTGLEKISPILEREQLLKLPYQELITQTEHLARDSEFASNLGLWLSMRLNRLPKSYRPFYLKLSKRLLTSIPLSLEYYQARQIDDKSLNKTHAISFTLLGWACGKYHPKRYRSIFPDCKTLLETDILGSLDDE